MAFQHASASLALRADSVLSADNAPVDRFTLIDTLRAAAAALPFGPPVIATLDALLSCLPAKRNHNLVFASNATLVLRRNGISDRTLRRHLAELVQAGMLTRVDSPNGKRYSRHDPMNGTTLRFGLDLSPLFAAFPHLHAMAQEQARLVARIAYLRAKLRKALHHAQSLDADDPLILQAQRALRRKLSVHELETLLHHLPQPPVCERPTSEPAQGARHLSASNGQNVRHHQNPEKELNEKKDADLEQTAPAVHPQALVDACPQAAGFLVQPVQTERDVIRHARQLAPMIGINPGSYEAAETRLGAYGAALTIWGLLELLPNLRQPGAYFRSITTGKRSSGFQPFRFIAAFVARAARNDENCPRTTANAAFA